MNFTHNRLLIVATIFSVSCIGASQVALTILPLDSLTLAQLQEKEQLLQKTLAAHAESFDKKSLNIKRELPKLEMNFLNARIEALDIADKWRKMNQDIPFENIEPVLTQRETLRAYKQYEESWKYSGQECVDGFPLLRVLYEDLNRLELALLRVQLLIYKKKYGEFTSSSEADADTGEPKTEQKDT